MEQRHALLEEKDERVRALRRNKDCVCARTETDVADAVVAAVAVDVGPAAAVVVAGGGRGVGAAPFLGAVGRVLDTDRSRSSPLMSLCVVEYCLRGSCKRVKKNNSNSNKAGEREGGREGGEC